MTSDSYRQTVQRVTEFFTGQGLNALDAKTRALAWIGQTISQQATLIAYLDVFWSAAIFSRVWTQINHSQ